MTTPVSVDTANARIVRGLALPYNQPALVLRGGTGHNRADLVLEVFDRHSFATMPASVPIYVEHDRRRPAVGVAHTFGETSYGLGLEGELLVSGDELEAWHRRFAAGVTAGLSVGFVHDQRKTVWEAPTRHGDPPIRRPRGVQVIETSLVQEPAFRGATVTSLSQRSADGQRRHEESERAILDWQRWRAEQQVRGNRLSGRRAG